MISLRLSNEEYESLRNLYRVHGSRSVSEFARNAMQKVIGDAQAEPANIETRLQELDSKMSSLDHEVGRLVRLIESRLANVEISAANAA
jgi:predicted DNA-binding protein